MFCNISTIVMVAKMNKTISEAFPTYFKNIFWAINCFIILPEENSLPKKIKYSSGCCFII